MFQPTVAVDTETRLIDRGADLAPELACATFCFNADYVPQIAVGNDVLQAIRHIASVPTLQLVGANFAFDAHVLHRAFPELTETLIQLYDSGRISDVQLNERLVDISRGQLDGGYDSAGKYQQKYYSLAALHDGYGLGKLDKSEDTWRLRYGELIGVELDAWPEDAKRYALDDARATLSVHEAQLQHSVYFSDSAAQARGAFALQKVAIRGVVTDGPAVEAYIKDLEQLVFDSGEKLKAAGFVRGNGSRDTKKVKAYMQAVCDENGLEPKLTATKQLSLDAEALREVSFDELLTAYGVYGTSDTLLTRAEQLREGSKGLPLQTSFQSLLENGRTSSRIPKAPLVGVQLQNMPREGKLRECIVPREGYYFCSIDFNSDEIACFAQAELELTGKSELAQALRDGLDVHCVLAASMLQEPYEVVFANRKVKGSKYYTARQLAKIGNFGSLGGMSAKTLWKHANKQAKRPEDKITMQQAQRVHAAWYARWRPEAYFEQVKAAIGRDGWNNVCQVTQLYSGRRRGALSYTEALNTLFSGLAADGNKDCLYQCVRAAMLTEHDTQSAFHDTHVVNMLHDELFFEVPISTATRSSKALCDLMLTTKAKWLKDVPVGAEPALMKRWYKRAEAVWSPDGELLPWIAEAA